MITPQANDQRNSIAQAMLNIASPPPRVASPLPPYRPLMGMPQMSPPNAPPTGAPVPQMPAPTLPLSAGVPPTPMQQVGMQPAAPQPQQQPMPNRGY